MERPRIVVTLSNPDRAADPAVASLKNQRYLDAVMRAGGDPLALDERMEAGVRHGALATMDGLLISGGADLDPARYGEATAGSHAPELGRDEIDAAAFAAAQARGVPVLGVCRGLQAINVFSGGTLLQDIGGHESEPYPGPDVTQHPVAIPDGTRLARIVGEPEALVVNSYHHQAVTADRLAPGLVANALADHDGTILVEGLEARDPDRWLIGVQCHPERTESSPVVLERLWAAFVAAARDRRRYAIDTAG
ncbi:MAG TPA: gamma-glutamyl-gamma-aminobutyrate hydrolase family protein [Candidatus Limnocylindria bacterium]|nr:gamma-glutamyl-gamma-aminobutyrate hydrolase family protein [Candidatus Limnocylindria bacterium]